MKENQGVLWKRESGVTSSKSAAAPIGADNASCICFMFSVCSLISSIVLSTSSMFLQKKEKDQYHTRIKGLFQPALNNTMAKAKEKPNKPQAT